MTPTKTSSRPMRPMRPKFKIGQVVAIFHDAGDVEATEYHRIKGFYFDNEDQLRYTFADGAGRTLSPVEDVLRALIGVEIGR